MKRMLINATQKEELRVALVEGSRLFDLEIETQGVWQTKANIYKGKVAKVTPSLDAVFVDYGEERHGFLPIKEIYPGALIVDGKFYEVDETAGNLSLKSFIKEGHEILVQVNKGARGGKGAALTTYISLAGSYLVLMPNNPKANGISRRIEGSERQQLKNCLAQLKLPDSMGLIVRTAGINKGKEELEWDLSSLLSYWEAIQEAAVSHAAPCLIHQEGSIIACSIRDHLRPDIAEIWVDEEETYALARRWIQLFKPDFIDRLKLYKGDVPLFNHFMIESQIEQAFQREVRLPSGGAIIIDITEALISIDVNSSRSTRGINIEETAYSTNLEAAEEIARQLRLRDLGGLVVVDFIDMNQQAHQTAVEETLKRAVKEDRARVQVGALSRFGLIELSRQRLRPSLEEFSSYPCPKCYGQGSIRGDKSLALSILRLLEETAIRSESVVLCALVPVSIGCYLLNEKRAALSSIETRYDCRLVIVPDSELSSPNYKILELKEGASLDKLASYHLAHQFRATSQGAHFFQDAIEPGKQSETFLEKEALLSGLRVLESENPSHPKQQKQGIFHRIWGWISGNKGEADTTLELDANSKAAIQGGPSSRGQVTRLGDMQLPAKELPKSIISGEISRDLAGMEGPNGSEKSNKKNGRNLLNKQKETKKREPQSNNGASPQSKKLHQKGPNHASQGNRTKGKPPTEMGGAAVPEEELLPFEVLPSTEREESAEMARKKPAKSPSPNLEASLAGGEPKKRRGGRLQTPTPAPATAAQETEGKRHEYAPESPIAVEKEVAPIAAPEKEKVEVKEAPERSERLLEKKGAMELNHPSESPEKKPEALEKPQRSKEVSITPVHLDPVVFSEEDAKELASALRKVKPIASGESMVLGTTPLFSLKTKKAARVAQEPCELKKA